MYSGPSSTRLTPQRPTRTFSQLRSDLPLLLTFSNGPGYGRILGLCATGRYLWRSCHETGISLLALAPARPGADIARRPGRGRTDLDAIERWRPTERRSDG